MFMDSETEAKIRSGSRTWPWVAVICAVVLATLVLVWVRGSGDTVTFRVVDAVTGQPLTNALGSIRGRWTSLPVEKWRIPGLSAWKTAPLKGVNGRFEVSGVPRQESDLLRFIAFTSFGYHSADFSPSSLLNKACFFEVFRLASAQ
jgi:hypothetical protein